VIIANSKTAAILERECPRTVLSSAPPLPGDGEIHVWHANFGEPQLDINGRDLLSPDERARMNRFRFEHDRDNFIFCRSMLRILLASYLGTPPAELVFAYSAHGKPSLAAQSGDLEFNVSHSHGIVLFAFTRGTRVGVDVEHIRRDLSVQEIAGRFFSTAEKRALMECSDMYDAFFHCWTRKEAFVKARGEGLSCPLESFDVAVTPEKEMVSLTTRPDANESRNWRLWSLNSYPGYAAAVAVEVPNGL
jgi:4'-phosphopantetheinyl transferase